MSDELKALGLNLRVVGVDELTPHPRNYNRHSEQQVRELAQSLDDFGQYKNVVGWSDPDNGAFYILAGEGLWSGAKERGDSQIIINDRSDLTRVQAMALLVSDNLTPSDDFDYPLLADIVTDLDFPADVPGLDDEMLAGILEMAQGPIGDTSTDRDGQGVGSTWDQVNSADTGPVVIGDIETRLPADVIESLAQFLQRRYERCDTPIFTTLEAVIVAGMRNVESGDS